MLIGRVSIADTKKSFVKPGSMVTSTKSSAPLAFRRYGFGIFTIRSGLMCQVSLTPKSSGFGMSAGLPCGAPASTHFEIVWISWSESDGSLLNFWMPTCLSMNQGGISRFETFALMARAHGRASW